MKAGMKLENRSKHNEQTCCVSQLFNKVPGHLMNVNPQPFSVLVVVNTGLQIISWWSFDVAA